MLPLLIQSLLLNLKRERVGFKDKDHQPIHLRDATQPGVNLQPAKLIQAASTFSTEHLPAPQVGGKGKAAAGVVPKPAGQAASQVPSSPSSLKVKLAASSFMVEVGHKHIKKAVSHHRNTTHHIRVHFRRFEKSSKWPPHPNHSDSLRQ